MRGDILDRELLRTVVHGQDAVVHFAAESHVVAGGFSLDMGQRLGIAAALLVRRR